MSSPIAAGRPYSPEETQCIIEQFNRDGYCHLGPVLAADEVEALREAMACKVADPRILNDEAGDHIRGISLMRMFEYSEAFRDLVVREPFVSLAEAILGDNCHLMSQNALYTEPDSSKVPDGPGGWHLDDLIHFPLPDEVEQHDPSITMPCFVLQIFTPVSDVESIEYGPTQVVPGSHRAGRGPAEQDKPTFCGTGPISLFARAGDAYMFNNQIWHRGAPKPRIALASWPALRTASALFHSASILLSTTACRRTCWRVPRLVCNACSAATRKGPTAEVRFRPHSHRG